MVISHRGLLDTSSKIVDTIPQLYTPTEDIAAPETVLITHVQSGSYKMKTMERNIVHDLNAKVGEENGISVIGRYGIDK